MNSKWMKIFMVLMVTMFAASTAFATIELSSRSEEMTAFSQCDEAGSITLAFTDADYAILAAHLAPAVPPAVSNEWVRIRATLTGTDIDPGAQPPTLCKAISGLIDGVGEGANGGNLPALGPGQGYVLIDELDIEVSDLYADAGVGVPVPDGVADVVAYVYGALGSRYFDIYITAIADDTATTDSATVNPWIKVGLYDELVGVDATSICANVLEFGGLSKLTVSYNFIPTSLTINSSDNEIGHFLEDEFTLTNCTKLNIECVNPDTTSIALCPLEVVGQAEVCASYYKCAIVSGDFPSSGDVRFFVRSNGAINGANTQEGVYITNVSLVDGAGNPLAGADTYYQANGTTVASVASCAFLSEQFSGLYDAADIEAGGSSVQYCITYQVDPDLAAAGTDVRFWVEATTLPCGTLYNNEIITAATLYDCAGVPSCMYFPYVLSGVSPWATGVVITNITAGSASEVAIADMEAIFTMVDSTGTALTYTKSDFEGAVFSFTVDAILAEAGWAPAAGNAMLKVQTNFSADGYSFLTNGAFGAGTLPRLQTSCGSLTSLR